MNKPLDALNTLLRGGRACLSMLPFRDKVLPLALQEFDDNLCVPRQLACLLKIDIQSVCAEFEEISPGFREKGLSSKQIMDYCERSDIDYDCLIGGQVYEWRADDPMARVCWTGWNGHAYFYRTIVQFGPVKPSLRKQAKDAIPALAGVETVGAAAETRALFHNRF